MRTKTESIPLKSIVIDEEIYPRVNYGWQTAYDYSQSMLAGSTFPPIQVNKFAGKTYLIDGRHRLEAYKLLKRENVVVEVLNLKTREEMFLESINTNIRNSRAFTPQDKAMMISRLKKMDFTDDKISEIVRIPVGKISSFVAKRITMTTSGEEVFLKAPLKNLAGVPLADAVIDDQKVFSANSQQQITEQLIRLLESDAINLKNPKVLRDLKIIFQLIRQKVMSTRKR